MNVPSTRRDDKFIKDKLNELYTTWEMYAKMLPTFVHDFEKNGFNVKR